MAPGLTDRLCETPRPSPLALPATTASANIAHRYRKWNSGDGHLRPSLALVEPMQRGAKPAVDGGFWVRAREREQGGPRMTRTRNRDTEAARIDEVLRVGDHHTRYHRAQ